MDPPPSQPPRTSGSSTADAGNDEANSSRTQVPPPLKRGSACQYCRRRKLRCSGTKPVCEGCIKYKRECVYDAPPAPKKQKVKDLEHKIANLEAMLMGQKSEPEPPPPPPLRRRQSHTLASNDQPNIAPAPVSTHPAAHHPHPYLHASHPPALTRAQVIEQQTFSTALEELFSADQLHPPSTSAGSEAPFGWNAASSPGGPLFTWGEEGQAFDGLAVGMAGNGLGLADDYGGPPVEDRDGVIRNSAYAVQPNALWTGQVDDSYQLPVAMPATTIFPPPLSFPTQPHDTPSVSLSIPIPRQPSDAFAPPLFPPPQPSPVAPILQTDLLTGHLIVPREIRDSLLPLFWFRKRQFGLVMHDRFFQRLDATTVDEEPHPALVLAMLTCAAKFSPFEALRKLETVFLTECKRRLDLGITEDDPRVVNLVQAITILSVWCCSTGRYREGWVHSGVALRLATACQLHRIRPPFYEPYTTQTSRYHLGRSRRKVPTLLAPPADMIEVGERIWSFWLCMVADKSISVANSWPCAMNDAEVETAFPRPLGEYVEGYDTSQDSTVADLYLDLVPGTPAKRPDTLSGCIMRSLLLLTKTSRLWDTSVKPESGQPAYSAPRSVGQSAGASSSSPSTTTNTATSSPMASPFAHSSDGPQPVPEECLDLQRILERFVQTIPAAYRDPSRKVAGGILPWNEELNVPSDLGDWDIERPARPGEKLGVNPVVILLWTQIFISFLLLYEEQARYDPSLWQKSVSAAKSVVQLIQLIANVDFGKLDLFLVVCWRFASSTLLAEAKLQRMAGNDEAASSAAIEVEVLVLAMQRLGQVFTIGDNHANLVKDMQDLDLGRVGGEGAGSADGMQADLPGHTLAHSQSFC